jgi:archaellum component FlaF (FlaF/FlaG flagellin family)
MKPLKIIKSLSLILIFSTLIQAQLFLDLQILNSNAQVFPIGDLNFAGAVQSTNYFNIFIQNNGSSVLTLRLKMEIRYNGDLIATGESNYFDLPGNSPQYVLTSQQLSLGTAIVDGQMIELGDYDVDFGAVDNLEQQAIETGTAPSGNYDFILKATDLSGNEIATDVNPTNNSITITNPTYIELITPGYSVSDPVIMEIYSLYLFAQWQTDVPPGNASYDIFFYQKYPEDVSVQDVLNNPPVLQVEGYPNNFLQYPTDTSPQPGFLIIRPLEPGKIYYWYVRSNIPTGTGTITIESDVFRFKISELAGTNTSNQQLIALLQQMLGQNFVQVLTNLIEQGFDPNGEINYNGQSGDMNTLMDLANQIVTGQATIQSVEVY